MPPTIEIDNDVFELLKRNAEPLVDTPSTVLRRMLGLDTNGDVQPATKRDAAAAPSHQGHRGHRKRHRRSSAGQRAARGTLLPESEYEIPILRYLDEHGGRAPSREVVEAVGETLADRLTEADRETLRSGEVRWKSRAAFARLRLVERGDLDGGAPRGTWQITEQGRQRLHAGT